MEQRKIFLEKNRSVNSTNKENFLGVDLVTTSRALPYTSTEDKLSLYKLYNAERDVCSNFRLIFTINPICSNVLFNAQTEVVAMPGSDYCQSLNFQSVGSIKAQDAIKNTQYSHPELGNYTYYCGYDIFNNHTLRSKNFTHPKWTSANSSKFNTIEDLQINSAGEVEKDVTGVVSTSTDKLKEVPINMYQRDTIMPFGESFVENLREKNGWYGFTNATGINIPNKGNLTINKTLNNRKPCEFIDLYPDRSLYSFIPKINEERKRIEKNWDYCITYPFSSTTEDWEGLNDNDMGLMKVETAELYYTDSAEPMVRFHTKFKHSFKGGDRVRLYYKSGDNIVRDTHSVRVFNVGDTVGSNTDKYFTIRYSEMGSLMYEVSEDNIGTTEFFYRKEVNNTECKYYMRLFAPLGEYTSEINKLAYGENIYGDRMAQIVFTDDINVAGKVDNLGRPLSELYLTIVKRNAGHEEWYEENDFNNPDIEFSHCFGEVTSGFDLDSPDDKYNVRTLNNINLEEITEDYRDETQTVFSGLESGTPLETNIVIGGSNYGLNKYFYGDLVEFNPATFEETVIAPVYHRFNTAQRETVNPIYYDIWADEITSDAYDLDDTTTYSAPKKTAKSTYKPQNNRQKIVAKYQALLMSASKSSTVWEGSSTSISESGKIGKQTDNSKFNVEHKLLNEIGGEKFAGNLNPEGFFYTPHHKIQIREFDETVSKVQGEIQSFASCTVETEEMDVYGSEEKEWVSFLTFQFEYQKKFVKEDMVALCKKDGSEIIWGTVSGSLDNETGTQLTVLVERTGLTINDDYHLLTTEEAVPFYAKYIPGTQQFVWRGTTLPSELPGNSALYDLPFANGAFYIHTNVNFFLRRQDPDGRFGLYNADPSSPLKRYRVDGWKPIDFSDLYYTVIDSLNVCM